MPEHETEHFKLPYPDSIGEAKLGAVDIGELAKAIDTLLFARLLTVKSYSGAATLASGELAIQTAGTEKTFTLPSASTAGQIIGAFSTSSAHQNITTSGGAVINGDYISAASTLTLLQRQHVILYSDGTNWMIMAGQPKRGAKYTTRTELSPIEEARTISTTRPTTLLWDVEIDSNGFISEYISGTQVRETYNETGHAERMGGTLLLEPGDSWELTKSGGAGWRALHASWRIE